MNENKLSLFVRYLEFFGGLILIALGLALTIKADLGTPPPSVIPYVTSRCFSYSIGVYTILLNILFVAIQAAILRRNFKLHYIVQIGVGFFFGAALDIWMNVIIFDFYMEYYVKFIILMAGIIISSLGIFIEIKANILMTAAESLVVVITYVSKLQFSSIKIIFDITLVTLGVIISLINIAEIIGVREGTILSALLTGIFVKIFQKLFNKIIY